MQNCSELFERVFSSHCSGIVRDCCCGRTYFNSSEDYCFEDGELECLLEQSKKDPEKYIEVDYSIGTMEIDGKEIVIGCKCDIAKKYENFILNHAQLLAKYLNEYAKQLEEKAQKVKVNIK